MGKIVIHVKHHATHASLYAGSATINGLHFESVGKSQRDAITQLVHAIDEALHPEHGTEVVVCVEHALAEVES